MVCVTIHFCTLSLPQDGWTAVLLAAYHSHKNIVQELCETFGADFLHRKKVRAMHNVSGSERIVHVPNYHVWLHSQDVCQPAVVHEVTVSASGSVVHVGVAAGEQHILSVFSHIAAQH